MKTPFPFQIKICNAPTTLIRQAVEVKIRAFDKLAAENERLARNYNISVMFRFYNPHKTFSLLRNSIIMTREKHANSLVYMIIRFLMFYLHSVSGNCLEFYDPFSQDEIKI